MGYLTTAYASSPRTKTGQTGSSNEATCGLADSVSHSFTKQPKRADLHIQLHRVPPVPSRRSGRIGIDQGIGRANLQPDYKQRMIMLIRV
jgi:hypothetical protein